jgi:hypothetical protein
MEFIKFSIKWIASNLSIPFWTLGHIHLSINVYEDVHEIIASFGMNIIVGVGFWLEWRETNKNKHYENQSHKNLYKKS